MPLFGEDQVSRLWTRETRYLSRANCRSRDDPHELELRCGEPARQERSAASERHRRDAEEDLVEKPPVRELTDEVAAADEPDVLPPAASAISS